MRPMILSMPVYICVFALVSAASTVAAQKPAAKATSSPHQEGDMPVVEGHKLAKFPIYVTQHLSAGEHTLGTL